MYSCRNKKLSEVTLSWLLIDIKQLVCITEFESVYRTVRTESFYNTDTFRL
jgi:hypothetical protein